MLAFQFLSHTFKFIIPNLSELPQVEHAIGGMKKCRIVKERFRCHKFGFEDMVILIACGLHNFRIRHKMSHITN